MSGDNIQRGGCISVVQLNMKGQAIVPVQLVDYCKDRKVGVLLL